MKRLTLVCSVNSFTGYGLHGMQIARDLGRLGVHVSIRPIDTSEAFGARVPDDIRQRIVQGPQPEEWELLLRPPNFGPTPGKRTAYFTMWEATKLPPHGAHFLNSAEVVIVPSEWNAVSFSAGGVRRPIRIVQLGINTDVFNFRTPCYQRPICIFGTGGRMAHGGVRKGINQVIEAFRAAFPSEDDVALRVKGWPDCPISQTGDTRIEIIKEYLSEARMADWFANLDCFVSGAMAEGWGLMQHQAMAVGRPVISVWFGGVREFFDPTCGFALDYTLGECAGEYAGCGVMAQPDFDSMVDHMRSVYNNKFEALARGSKAADRVKNLSWQASNENLAVVLEEFGAL